MNNRDINPIQWHEGMLLMPHHFQQADLRSEDVIEHYIKNLIPYFWGVSHIKIDDSLLPSGVFRLMEFEAILPDCFVISNEVLQNSPLELNLSDMADQIQSKPITVYLCIPVKKGNYSDLTGAFPRYKSAKSRPVSDINTGDDEVEVPRLLPNLSLIAGYDIPEKCVSIPIARVGHDSKSFSVAGFIPPITRVSLTSTLGGMCIDLTKVMRSKLSYLQQKVQSTGVAGVRSDSATEMESVRLRLISALMLFEPIFNSGESHPYEIYKALCAVVGHLAGISFGESAPNFDPYNHDDILGSVGPIFSYINKVIYEIEESYTTAQFTKSDGMFYLNMNPNWLDKSKLFIGVHVPPGASHDVILSWIKNAIMISRKDIKTAVDNRILGAERSIISEIDELDLIPMKGVILVSIKNDVNLILSDEDLCILNDGYSKDTVPDRIVLYSAKK